MAQALLSTNLPLPNRRQGKVRDVYDATASDGSPALVIVATDRLSAFDVVMPNGVPGKGVVLTQISRFWFDMIGSRLGGKLQHHLISTDSADIAGISDEERRRLRGRIMIGRRTKVIPIECVVRGYLAGSGWTEYRTSGTVCGHKLPPGLRQCDKLPEPIFTPATKEATGHDENISHERCCEIIGRELGNTLRDFSLAIYSMARDFAASRGIIIADTKFEFGIPVEQTSDRSSNQPSSHKPILIDEVLTPDSSRFWPADQYQPGRDQVSFDKQFVRNYLQELVDQGKWHKSPPGPTLPDDVVQGTLGKYLDAYRILTGKDLTL